MTYLTLAQVADLLHCHEESVRKAIRSGDLVASKVHGRWLVKPEDVERYFKASANVKRRAS